MAPWIARLTDLQGRKAKAGRHSDGGGLCLVVDASGARRWSFLWMRDGRRREMGLGSAASVTLAQARAEAARLRAMVQAGLLAGSCGRSAAGASVGGYASNRRCRHRAQAPDGASIGVHITWLTPGGTGKAPGAARKMLGAGFSGACVRLGDGPDVVVAEGIESALSAAHALGLSPVAALSAGGVAAWRPWPGVRGIMFAPDRDPSGVGERAARAAADRLHRAGWTIHGFALPPAPFCDWNDAARAAGKGGAS